MIFKLNIVSQLLMFFVMAIAANFLPLSVIVGLMLMLILLLIFTKNKRFLSAIKRFKWFFLVMLLIIALNTPGQHVTQWPFSLLTGFINPTYEGIKAGFTQMLRIMLMLAGLSLILAINTRQQLISGLYYIVSPMQYFGLKVERFAARLWLTLYYVELQNASQNVVKNSVKNTAKEYVKNKQLFFSQLSQITRFNADEWQAEKSITLAVPIFTLIDYVTFFLLFLSVIAILIVTLKVL